MNHKHDLIRAMSWVVVSESFPEEADLFQQIWDRFNGWPEMCVRPGIQRKPVFFIERPQIFP